MYITRLTFLYRITKPAQAFNGKSTTLTNAVTVLEPQNY